jgi:hypothetical protein
VTAAIPHPAHVFLIPAVAVEPQPEPTPMGPGLLAAAILGQEEA